jgi:hypothetical protein
VHVDTALHLAVHALTAMGIPWEAQAKHAWPYVAVIREPCRIAVTRAHRKEIQLPYVACKQTHTWDDAVAMGEQSNMLCITCCTYMGHGM